MRAIAAGEIEHQVSEKGEKMNSIALMVLAVCISPSSAAPFAVAAETLPAINGPGDIANQKLDADLVTTSWDLSFLYEDKEAAVAEYQKLELASEQINQTNRPKFGDLTGPVLLDYLGEDEDFSKRLTIPYAYANAQNSLNVNDEFFQCFLSDVQNLSTEYAKAISFATVRLKSLPRSEWSRLFAEEPQLETYRLYLKASYIRYADHRPRNETHAAHLADLGNELRKLDTIAEKLITNNVTAAGNITLSDGSQYAVNSTSYYDLLMTNANRDDRKSCYDQRYRHLFNESEEMRALYVNKSRLDDEIARELNFSDAYEAEMFGSYLNASQIDEMNKVFKERKGDFDGYYEFRRARMGVDKLALFDLFLQLLKDPGRKTGYTDALKEIEASFSRMDPEFNWIFIKTVASGSVDVYPNPDGGKQSSEFAQDLCALKRPALVFLNYQG